MQAIILAGGFGTRLKDLVSDIPKPMAPIRGVPFLSYILDQLNNNGFTKVVLAIGYLGYKIKAFYGLKYKNLNITYSSEESPLGTGGCVYKALDKLEDEYIFVINGDTFFDVNFKKITKPKNVAIICKHIKDVGRYGRILFNNDYIITDFQEKTSNESGYINGGIYYLRKNIFDNYRFESKFSLEKDFFEKYVNQLEIEVHISKGYFIDIGVPEDYQRAQNDL